MWGQAAFRAVSDCRSHWWKWQRSYQLKISNIHFMSAVRFVCYLQPQSVPSYLEVIQLIRSAVQLFFCSKSRKMCLLLYSSSAGSCADTLYFGLFWHLHIPSSLCLTNTNKHAESDFFFFFLIQVFHDCTVYVQRYAYLFSIVCVIAFYWSYHFYSTSAQAAHQNDLCIYLNNGSYSVLFYSVSHSVLILVPFSHVIYLLPVKVY